jgi:hypothetical protein
MSRCCRCKTYYREPEDEQGSHDCPHCGLRPEDRCKWLLAKHEEEREDDDD